MFFGALVQRSLKMQLVALSFAIGAMGLASHVSAITYPTPNLLTNDGFETNLLTRFDRFSSRGVLALPVAAYLFHVLT